MVTGAALLCALDAVCLPEVDEDWHPHTEDKLSAPHKTRESNFADFFIKFTLSQKRVDFEIDFMSYYSGPIGKVQYIFDISLNISLYFKAVLPIFIPYSK